MALWWTDLEDLHDMIWRELERGVAERAAAGRHLVLATAGSDGGGEARLVVLRAASVEDAVLEVHTDSASAKVGDIAREPWATFLFWDPALNLQVRLKARCEIRKGAGAERLWSRIPKASQAVYGVEPRPGTEITAPEHVSGGGVMERFAILTARVEEIDALHLGEDRHRRARFRAEVAGCVC